MSVRRLNDPSLQYVRYLDIDVDASQITDEQRQEIIDRELKDFVDEYVTATCYVEEESQQTQSHPLETQP